MQFDKYGAWVIDVGGRIDFFSWRAADTVFVPGVISVKLRLA